ncbi:hypothetical protein P7K49_001036 [Saguinus oedipus]|uniref:Uncharacterized protein n=1 Tax=Saguinus oedipus TaxID=9490 RepID=A0ABQ9WDU4_SAGOE|nr:hypothetical protein P7K49_001036 [Saguinus oedipus]
MLEAKQQEAKKRPTSGLKALGKSCKNNTCRCGGLFSDPWRAEGHEEIMRLEDRESDSSCLSAAFSSGLENNSTLADLLKAWENSAK